MNAAFFGTSRFAVPSLRALAQAHDIVLVVSQPDRPRGRGLRLIPPPVKKAAEELGLTVFQPEDVNVSRSLERIAAADPEIIVVVSFGQKLGHELLQLPPRGCFNVHGSLLPKYRGAAPVEWAIINGEQETGVTVIKMNERMDAGPVAASERTVIGPEETAGELQERLAELGARLLLRVIDDVAAGQLHLQPQNESDATNAPKLNKSDGLIDWSLTPRSVADFVRGVSPWPGAFAFLRDEASGRDALRLIVRAVESLDRAADAEPGQVISADEALVVAVKGGAVRLRSVQPAGKKAMSDETFLRGHPVRVGAKFGGPG